jgi:hypothetical protein
LGKFETREKAMEKMMTHLRFSPYHKLPADLAKELVESAQDDDEKLKEYPVEEEEEAAVEPIPRHHRPQVRPPPPDRRRGSMRNAPAHSGHMAATTVMVENAVERVLERVMTQAAGVEEPPAAEQRIVGQKMKSMSVTELQIITDSMDRASKAARSAERMSSAAALAFASEASALEQARAYMIQKLN